MAKGPLITRSELRRRQQMQAQESLKRQRKEEAAYQQEEKKIASFYRKENKKMEFIFDEILDYCYCTIVCCIFSSGIYLERRK